MRYGSAKDPGIGFGNEAASQRLSQPCYKEYGISNFQHNGRQTAPNYRPSYAQTFTLDPQAFNRKKGMHTSYQDS